MADDLDLRASIEKAIGDNPPTEEKAPAQASSTETTEKEPEVSKEEATEKESTEEKEESEEAPTNSSIYSDDLTEEQIIEARQVYRGLRDPQQRNTIIEFLATQAGFKKGETPTKEEVKEKATSIVDELKSSMQPEFAFLADQLGPGIEKVINARVKAAEDTARKVSEESVKDLREERQREKAAKIEIETNKAYEAIAQDYYTDGKFPAKIDEEMSAYMDRHPPNSKQSAREYLEEAFFVATAKNGGIPNKTKQVREDRSRTNAATRLATSREATAPVPGQDIKEYVDIKSAVAAAAEAVNAQMNK